VLLVDCGDIFRKGERKIPGVRRSLFFYKGVPFPGHRSDIFYLYFYFYLQ